MNRFSSIWIIISCVLLALQLATDYIQITYKNKFLEGYGYGIYLLIFDLSVFIPLILILVKRDKFLIAWSLLTVFSLNITPGFGWQWGSLIGVLVTIISLTTYFNKKQIVSYIAKR